MKIGMILDGVFPPDPRVENEAISLINKGFEVHLFCLNYSTDQKTNEIIKGINVHRKRVPKHLYSFSSLAYTIPYYHLFLKNSISEFLETYNIDTIHVHDMQVARSVFWANKKLSLPITLDLHENRPEIMKHYTHVNSFLGKLLISPARWKNFEFEYIKKADRVITITQDAADYYLNKIEVESNKFFVVPNTVRKEFYTDYVQEEDIIAKYKETFNLLYLGDTGLRRGLLTVLESLEYLILEIPNIKIIIVGSSKDDHILNDFVERNNYQNYVDFTGWKDVSLFQSYIIASDIGICPLHRNLHHDTTYANKLFQYMAFGKPIVVSDCTSQKKLVEDYNCGLYFTEKDSKDFADSIISIAKNKELRNTLSNNAKNAIKERLNWESISQELFKFIDMKEIKSNSEYNKNHQDRFNKTISFLKSTGLTNSSNILNLGPANPLAELIEDEGYNITCTDVNQDLDLDFEIVKNDKFDTIVAFEILEHLVSPFPLLRYAAAEKLIITVPLSLWFAKAYWNENDQYDRHYHEFEEKQLKMLLEKAGWRIIKHEKHIAKGKGTKLGIRPLLRRITPRYYFVYCERIVEDTTYESLKEIVLSENVLA